jgi:hypothetical protein
MGSCGGSGGGGSSATVVADTFSLASVEPQTGPAPGGTFVVITGEKFLDGVEGGNTVTFGGLVASEVTTVSDTTITCMTPAGLSGESTTVTVTNSLGAGNLEQGFTYLVLPEPVSDLNADGIADVIVGAPRESSAATNAGAVYVFFGSDQTESLTDRNASAADLKLTGALAGDSFGASLITGDLDGDGEDDLIVGATGDDTAGVDAGAVYIFLGPLPGGTTLSAFDADVVISGDATQKNDYLGGALALGDIDADGAQDLIVAARGHDAVHESGSDSDAGAVYVFSNGASLTTTTVATASHVFFGQESGDRLGNRLVTGDLNADGTADLVIAASLNDPQLPPTTLNGGSVYVIWGGEELTGGNVSGADVILQGTEINDEFGHAIAAGDLNNDGTDDLIVGVPLQDGLGSNVGRVYVFWGGELETQNAVMADVIIEGQPTNDAFGGDLSCGDVNGDGVCDLLIGARDASFLADGSGRAYVFLGGEDFTHSVATLADAIFDGEPYPAERFGTCTRLADVNGDGMLDVIASAPGNDAGGPGAGCVYTFLGSQDLEDRAAEQDDVSCVGEAGGNQFGTSLVDGQ